MSHCGYGEIGDFRNAAITTTIKRVLAVIVGLFALLGACVAWHLFAAGWL